jgi:hypothetical protein
MRSPAQYLRGIRHPEAFHGHGVSGGFFEGWYVKLVSPNQQQRWAVIPGVFRGNGKDEAFVQILDGGSGRSWYHRFEHDDFVASSDKFEVRVGGNRFSAAGVHLELPQLTGDLRFATLLDPWPIKPLSPGIMGWYGLMPFMECFHGIVSFGHSLEGSLLVEGKAADFGGGRGYIEKDWGQAFPAGYVWLHSNHFASDANASFIGSVAIIPFLGREFRGYIVGLKHSGRLHRWATYNRSKEKQLRVDDTHINWILEGHDGTLEISAERVRGGLLHAPLRTAMHQRVEESLDAKIKLRHVNRDGTVVFEDLGTTAGLEVFGDITRLLAISN